MNIESFKKRKKILTKVKESRNFKFNVNEDLVNKHLNSEVDIDQVEQIEQSMFNSFENFELNPKVSDEEVEQLLNEFNKGFNDQKFDNLFSACKSDVLSAIIIPFGLGRFVSSYDKNGGNVTTIHNAKDDVYARKEDAYNRKKYTEARNSDGEKFENAGKKSIGSVFTRGSMDQKEKVTDAYTGKIYVAKDTSPDHIVSNKEFHTNGGFMLSSEDKANFATDKNNLAITERSLNQSLRADDKKEWENKKSDDRDVPNKEFYDIDDRRLNAAIKRGKETATKHKPSTMQKAKFYSKNIAKTGVNEGAKMGFQQAIGLVTYEFFEAVFFEIKDIYSNGFDNGIESHKFFEILKERLIRIGKKIAAKWKDFGKEFSGGFISGFISNLVTVVINMFIRTGKRIVRIIREGFFSILKALKMLCFPPEGMTYAEVAHEASKLIAAGLVVVGGILVEQHIDNLIKAAPVLEIFSDILTSVIIGALTGLATTFIVYAIDKLDIFNVNDKKRHEYVMEQMENKLNCLFDESDFLIEEVKQLAY